MYLCGDIPTSLSSHYKIEVAYSMSQHLIKKKLSMMLIDNIEKLMNVYYLSRRLALAHKEKHTG